MPYHDSLKDLLELVDFLKTNYTSAIPQHLSFIAILDEITIQVRSNPNANKMKKILLGASVFELEANRYLFAFLLPEDVDEMSRLINQKLKITAENPLKNDERLYYISKFVGFVEKLLQEQSIQKMKQAVQLPAWNDKTELLKDIHDKRKLLMQKNAELIGRIAKTTPESITLQIRTDKFIRAHDNVEISVDNRIKWINYPQNKDREIQLNFIRTLHQTCPYYFPLSQQDLSLVQKAESEMRRGLLLFGMMEVKSEPKYWFLSPEGGACNSGSDLFKNASSILDNLKNHTAAEKGNWLNALLEYINNLKNDKAYYAEIVKEWSSKGLDFEKASDAFIKKIQHYIKTFEKEDLKPSLTEWAISKVTGYGTKYILKKTVDWGTSEIGKISVTALAVTVGASTGSILSFALMYTMLQAAASKTSDYLIEKVSSEIGEKTADFISDHVFPPIKKEFESLRNELSPEEDKVFCRVINTLLTLPNDTFSEAEKNHIKKIFPLDENGKLHPLSQKKMDLIPQSKAPIVKFFSDQAQLTTSVIENYDLKSNIKLNK